MSSNTQRITPYRERTACLCRVRKTARSDY